MKPIILVTPADVDGQIHLSPEELRRMIDQAYNAGYADGVGQNINWMPYWDPFRYTCNYVESMTDNSPTSTLKVTSDSIGSVTDFNHLVYTGDVKTVTNSNCLVSAKN